MAEKFLFLDSAQSGVLINFNFHFEKKGKMRLKERYRFILDYFMEHKPLAETELHYSDTFQLLVAVILSAQCTDKRVNMITPELFKVLPDATSMASASQETILNLIKSCSYPNSKAKYLKGMALMVIEKFNGVVPTDIEELQMLPGVGRKTANVIASVTWNAPVIAVDTHVFRVARRLGLVPGARNPLEVEMILTENIPSELRPLAHHWLILHGRYVCTARKPMCHECEINKWCRYFQSNEKQSSITNQ
jgi:endonuclease III